MAREEENYYGKHGTPQKYDPTFKGPIHDRGCTDIICCILLLIAIVGYVAVGVVAWTQGDPRKVIYPTDSRGQFCGQKGTINENRPYLFYFNIMKCASPLVLLEFQCPTTQICVNHCPDRYLTLSTVSKFSIDREYYHQFCVAGFKDLSKSLPEILRDGDCPAMLTPSRPCKSVWERKQGRTPEHLILALYTSNCYSFQPLPQSGGIEMFPDSSRL